jgi:putative ABC transport system substrate-binding protein
VIPRRDFITLLGGAAAWPLAARGQQAMPVIGYLAARSLETDSNFLAAFRQGLAGSGFVEGQNVRIEYRFADAQSDRLAAMAADLVGRHVAVIVASTAQAAQAAKNATTVIPIVFGIGFDPVTSGFVTSLSHPSSNLTGVTTFAGELGTKQFGLMHEIGPGPAVIAYLHDARGLPPGDPQKLAVQSAAHALGRELLILNANDEWDIDAAFRDLGRQQIGGLLVSNGVFFGTRLHQLVALANHYRFPTVYPRREFAVAGGLVSYGTSTNDAYRQIGIYAAKILKGTTPADLPVLLPTKFELIINIKTAKATGFEVPPGLSARADEIIE